MWLVSVTCAGSFTSSHLQLHRESYNDGYTDVDGTDGYGDDTDGAHCMGDAAAADDTGGDHAGTDADGDAVDCISEFSTSLSVSSECLVVCGLCYFVSLLCGSDISLSLTKCFAVCLFKGTENTVCRKTEKLLFFNQRS